MGANYQTKHHVFSHILGTFICRHHQILWVFALQEFLCHHPPPLFYRCGVSTTNLTNQGAGELLSTNVEVDGLIVTGQNQNSSDQTVLVLVVVVGGGGGVVVVVISSGGGRFVARES